MKEQILRILADTSRLIPNDIVPDLPATELIPDVPEWHPFEHKVWRYGEEIRQIISSKKVLRDDKEIQQRVLQVACNSNAKRGRQSFIMLLGYSCCSEHAPNIAKQLIDPNVTSHVISVLNKMGVADFVKDIEPFVGASQTLVRSEAKNILRNIKMTNL